MASPRLAALLVVLLMLVVSPDVEAGGCTCRGGNGCYHFLKSPVEPPDDPCNCPQCRMERGTCPKKYPKDWNPVCADNRKMECFLRRHAASWGIVCSEMLAGTCECKSAHPEWCPSCGNRGHDWTGKDLPIIEKQLAVERPMFGPRAKIVIAKSPHFILITDIPKIKVRLQKNPRIQRVAKTHEIAHLYLQRAEIAYAEFVAAFGDKVHLPRPSAIYLVKYESTKEAIASAYFGLPKPELAYGGDWKRIGGGYPYNALAISFKKYDSDYWLHQMMRHCIGHLLVSCWVKVTGKNEFLPRWAYAGVGHWLSRNPRNLKDMSNFCFGEGKSVKHGGEKWPEMLRKIAGDPDSHPIQRLYDATSLGDLDLEMHQRAWSWFELFLREDRERFVAFLAALREGTNHRVALQATMGMTPEEFDRRWRDRILGKRPSVAPTAAELDAANPESEGARARAAIRSEADPQILAAKIRALLAVNDPLTAETLVPLLRHESELVRETIVLVLSKTTSDAAKEWLRTEGLVRVRGEPRAQVVRVIANALDRLAGEELARYWTDANWMVRAHVARALARIGYEPAIPRLVAMLRDSSAKTRVAAMEALGSFGRKSAEHWDRVADHLGAAAWQERCAAARCLGGLGEMKSVENLIDRMEVESGRVREVIREALMRITRDNLGRNPKYWREWWEREKEKNPELKPPGEAQAPPPDRSEYAEEPTYYGLEVFSRGVGYVLDTSGSMAYEFNPDPAWVKKSGREYPPVASKFDLAVGEIAASLRTLDPRVKMNLWFFRTEAMQWKSSPVPATPRNVESAISRIENQRPKPPKANPRTGTSASGQYRTNYVDTLRLVLSLKPGAPRSGGFGEAPDTIYFLTDGKPTVGDIKDPEILLAWLRERNRWAGIEVNVITYGSVEANLEFLRRLAEENGGRFVAVPSAD